MNKLNLTEENVIAIHEVGHLLSYLLCSVRSTNFSACVGKIEKLTLIEEGDVRGYTRILDIDTFPFRDFVKLSGCLTVFFYYNQGAEFEVENIKDFFTKTGGLDDIDACDSENLETLVHDIELLMSNPKYLKLIDGLARDMLEKKQMSRNGLQRLSYRLQRDLKFITEEIKRERGN